jgi:DNA mismatch repair protein MutL
MYNLPSGNFRQRIVNVFGGKTNEKLVPVKEETENVQINGFIAKPEFARKLKSEQFFFVNNRFIKSGYLHHAIMNAFEGLIKDGFYPAYYLYINVPPHTIDVNIHPTKTEIKFDDEHTLYSILRASIKHSLGQFNVSPILDFDRDSSLDTPYHFKDKEPVLPTVEVDVAFNPFETKNDFKSNVSYQKNNQSKSWESLYVGLKQDFETPVINYQTENKGNYLFESKENNAPVYRTYQLHKKYIVSPTKSGMLIIDQQRAHQRVLYEQFLTHITLLKGNSQQMLFPVELCYAANEIRSLNTIKEALENTGFVFDVLEHEKVVVSGVPVSVSESEISMVLDQLLSDIDEGIVNDSFSVNDRIAKSMAKSLAIKTGTNLAEIEQETLINSLFACKESAVSPFMKPTYINISVEELDKKFQL